nr:ubiquitin-like domain-containing protein CIP73 [Ipomoea batatas]
MDKNGSDENNDAIEIKIKTMFCHQTQTLRVDKRVGVGALKEEVTLVTGVLAEHQRLIFRGKALSDDKQLSDYHVEDGDTLHLIVTTTSHLSEQLSLITQMVSALLLSIAPPSTSLSAALERELHRAAIMDIYAMLGVRGLDAHRRAARSIRELRRASRPIRERRRASRWIRDTRHAASLSVRNRGSSSSSSSRDQPAPAASLMNVSLGNSAQLPMPNATVAALAPPAGNSIEETNADAEDRSKDDV